MTAEQFLLEYTRELVKTINNPMGRQQLLAQWQQKLRKLVEAGGLK